MSTMVEKVSAAIVSALKEQRAVLADDDQFKSVLVDQWLDITEIARAALGAIMDPTDDLLEKAMIDNDNSGAPYVSDFNYFRMELSLLIQAALKEEAQ